MGNDVSYKFKKEESNKYGSAYYKKGYGKKEAPYMTPYEYGGAKSRKRTKAGVKYEM